MISGRRYQALDPLCVSAPCGRHLPPANQAHQLPTARGPPLRKARELPAGRYAHDCAQTPSCQPADLTVIPARHAAGPGGEAALAQLMAESHPGQKTKGTQHERAYANGRSMQGPEGPRSLTPRAGAATAAGARHRRWWSMSVITVILPTVSASMVTWLWTSARWRSKADEQAAAWRRVQSDLLAEMSSLQDDAERARTHTAQVASATAEWSAGYKQGCSDMINAMAALHGGSS